MTEKALQGLALEDVFIFDVHAHIGNCSSLRLVDGDAQSLLKTMDQLQVNGTCVSAVAALESGPDVGNELVAEAVKAYPGRIYGYVTPSPYYSQFPLERYFEDNPGMIGVKIHGVLQQTVITDERYESAIAYADKHKLPVLFHAWTTEEVVQVARWAEKYHNCPLIIGHGGFTADGAKEQAVGAVRRFDNVFVDTCISSTYDGAIEWLVAKVGADRVLYGTDHGYFDCRQTYGKLALSKLKEEEKRKIFGENARKLFRIQCVQR